MEKYQIGCSGFAQYWVQRIRISDNLIERFYNNSNYIYSVILHEIFHILAAHYEYRNPKTFDLIIENCSKENVEDESEKTYVGGLAQSVGESYGTAMMEAFNETAISFLYNHNRNIYISDDPSYSRYTFLPHLLSASIGTTDNQLVYESTKSPREFDELIMKQFGLVDTGRIKAGMITERGKPGFDKIFKENILMIRVKEHLRLIDEQMDSLFQLWLEEENEAKALITSSLKSIMNATYSLANLQIDNDSRPVSQELIDELFVRYKKMDVCMNVAADKLGISKKEIYGEEEKSLKEEMLNRIFGVYVVNLVHEKVSDESAFEKLCEGAKNGKIFEIADEIKKYGIDIYAVKRNEFKAYMSSEQYKNSEYYRRLERDDLMSHKLWDDEKEYRMLDTFFRKSKIKNDEFKMLGTLEMIGLAMGKDINAYKTFSKSRSIKKVARDLGIQEEMLRGPLNPLDTIEDRLERISQIINENRNRRYNKKWRKKR